MGFQKGQPRPPNAGRKVGSANKATASLKEMILAALDKAGGADYLLRQADANPGSFMTLIGKVLPTTIAGDPNAPVKHELTLDAKKAAVKAIIDNAVGEDGNG